MKTIALFAAVILICCLGSCQKLIDPEKVIGSWIIAGDSSVMKLRFNSDSVFIGYPPGPLHGYSYQWKQDEFPGLMECYQETPLFPESRGRKIIPSELYVLKVNKDSISIFIPKIKTRFDMKRDRQEKK